MNGNRVVVCGNVVFDILARPVEEVRWEATTIVENVEQQLGGNAGSTSWTLAKLGIPVSIASLVGRDATGETVLRTLEAVGVETSLVRYVDEPTSIAIALIRRNGERALLYQLGAASETFPAFTNPPDATHFHLAAVYRMRHLRETAPMFLRNAREAGLRTSLDAQWDTEGEWMKVLAPSLPYVDYALLNEDEAFHLTGHKAPAAAARTLRDLGAQNVIIKLGPRGCWANGTEVPGHEVKAVDTTGAGDCFSGGFLAGLQRGMSVEEAARFANTVGALAVQKVGATAGVRNWDETLDWMQKNSVK
ncbi:MAG: carbohydrate kinase family protein [Acidobacteriota bacterium]